MNSFNQRQVVTALVMAAGLAGCAAQRTAQACPPEDGTTPNPSQQIEREVTVRTLPGGATTRTVTITTNSAQADDERAVVLAHRMALAHQPGSTLETRVYQPGEAMTLYGLKAVGDGPERVLRVKEDGRDIRVEQHGAKVTATINGKAVPADAITVKDGTIEVRDADGKTVLKEEWPAMNVTVHTFSGTSSSPAIATLPGVTWGGGADEEAAPKVMLGITMDGADDDTIQQLGLPDGDYAVITTVPEGLPAAKAGLQPRDIVVSVDGKTPASSDTIRDVMKEKKPGDTLHIEIARKGNRLKLDIPLEAFDGNRFKPAGTTAQGGSPDKWQKYAGEMEKKAKAWTESAQSRAELDRMREHLKMGIQRDSGEPVILMSPGDGSVKLEERLNAMEAQLERLEAMLKRFEARAAVPPMPPIPPVPPVPPVAPAAPSGGGGSPAPWFAIGV